MVIKERLAVRIDWPIKKSHLPSKWAFVDRVANFLSFWASSPSLTKMRNIVYLLGFGLLFMFNSLFILYN